MSCRFLFDLPIVMSSKLLCPQCGSKHCVMQTRDLVQGQYLHCMKCGTRFLPDGSRVDDTLTLNKLHARVLALESMVTQLYYAPGAPGYEVAAADFANSRER